MPEVSSTPRKQSPIDLAHQPDFLLGSLTVKASTREIVHSDTSRDVLEPRVMQVLVALHRASPNVVSRDDLVAQCLEGRVVGDDAINGAIGKLRRLSETRQGMSFAIETIPRVGYRLAVPAQPGQAAITDKSDYPGRGNRRALLARSVAVGVAALSGGWWLATRRPAPPASAQADTPPAVLALIARANMILRQGRLEADSEAAGLFQEAIDLVPENAEAWAGLALVDAYIAHNGPKSAYAAAHLRTLSALARAMALDPRNANAWQAKAVSYPSRGSGPIGGGG
jgi:DNA-binding winged helix-turn-helix (wHTH) protein